MSKLKNCPFCGGEAKLSQYYPYMTRRVKTRIYCSKCRANSGDWGLKNKAIEAWNTRKPIDNIVEQLHREKIAIAETATPRGNGKNYICGYVNATVRAIEVIMGELKTKGGLTNGKTSACDSL